MSNRKLNFDWKILSRNREEREDGVVARESI